RARGPRDGEGVDVVIWPEGGSDLDPLRVPQAARVFDSVSRAAGAPLVGWAVTTRGEHFFNTSLVWRAGEGAVDFYDKRHPVPFGEYVPDRAVWRQDRKSTRLNSSHVKRSYAVLCLTKKKN